MDKIPLLHKGALVLSFIIVLIAIAMLSAGLIVNSGTNIDLGFALVFASIFAFIVSITVFFMFLNQERIYRKTMKEPLLHYRLQNEELDEMKKRNIEEIKAQNLISLIIMLFFFLIIIVVGLFLGRDGRMTSLIMIIIAVIISISALIITKIRIERIRNSDNLVVVSKRGALLHGQFHNWSSLGARIDELRLELPDISRETQGRVQITYSALTRTGRNKMTLNIIFSAELKQPVLDTCRQLGWPQDYNSTYNS